MSNFIPENFDKSKFSDNIIFDSNQGYTHQSRSVLAPEKLWNLRTAPHQDQKFSGQVGPSGAWIPDSNLIGKLFEKSDFQGQSLRWTYYDGQFRALTICFIICGFLATILIAIHDWGKPISKCDLTQARFQIDADRVRASANQIDVVRESVWNLY